MITIITQPVLNSAIKKMLRYLHRHYRRIFYKHKLFKYGGHPAVTRSLVEGLEQLKIIFNCDPDYVRDIYPTVIVLSNVKALKQAVALRQQGRIQRLIAGPNLVVLPTDEPELLLSPFVDKYVVNSEWTYQLYVQSLPELKPKLFIWPAGVNTDYWAPLSDVKKLKKVLVYSKISEDPLLSDVITILKNFGFDVLHLKYGGYSSSEFLEILRHIKFAVFFSESESQGLAMIEAWSCDIPTFIWNKGSITISGQDYQCSSAPYLSEKTGFMFRGLDEFRALFDRFDDIINRCSPRRWVLENMSDMICADKMLMIAGVAVHIPQKYKS